MGAKGQFLRDAGTANFNVMIYYAGIASVQLSEARVSQRVRAGGHDVPPERLERRFRQSLANRAQALAFVAEAHVFDNSASDEPYRLVLSVGHGKTEFVADPLP